MYGSYRSFLKILPKSSLGSRVCFGTVLQKNDQDTCLVTRYRTKSAGTKDHAALHQSASMLYLGFRYQL